MNCNEYKQAIAADPSFDGGAGHLTQCPECQAYRRQMLTLNDRIGRALSLDVPELRLPELPEVDAGNVVALTGRRRVAPPVWFAMAASVLIAVVLGVRLLGTGVEFDSLGDEVLAHLQHEPYALRVSDTPVTDDRLLSVVPANIAQMDHAAGLITYAQSCVINGHEVPHLVIQGEKGPVTILLLPDEMVTEAILLSDEFSEGVILPVGNGSIAIIGVRGEQLEKIEQSVLDSVVWST
jgi:hypothetical protein